MSVTESLSMPADDQSAEELCRLFEQSWSNGHPLRLEDFLSVLTPGLAEVLLPRLLRIELQGRRSRGEQPTAADYLARFPTQRSLVEQVLREPTSSWDEGKTCFQEEIPDELLLDTEQRPSEHDDDRAWWPILPGYDIQEIIGQGGMGVVYRARQHGFNRDVAIKMVAGASQTPTQRRRFLAEGRAISQLRHPNIVEVYAPGEYRGQPYFVMELVSGGTLRQKIDDGPVDMRLAVTVILKVARAMHHAHVNHVVHRDLKPGNILLTPEGEPKVTDFGVAKLLQDVSEEKTRVGAVVGTPEYMAPEQASGQVGDVGPAADIYSLGVILFELLTTKRPIEGVSQVDTIQQVLYAAPDRLHHVLPPELLQRGYADIDAICQKCLEKEPHRRYGGANELADDLQRWLDGEPVKARPIGVAGRLWRWSKRKPVSAACALLLTLLVLTFVVATPVLFLFNREAQQQRDLARLKEREANRHVARLYASTGVRHLDQGDYFKALVWTTAALHREAQLSTGEPGPPSEVLRLRVAALLEACPRLVQRFQVQPWVEHLSLDESETILSVQDGARERLNRWRLEGGASVGTEFQPPPDAVKTLLAPDGRWALVQYRSGALKLWDVEARRATLELQVPAKEGAKLTDWLHLPGSNRVFAVFTGWDHAAAWLWDLGDGRLIKQEFERVKRWEPDCIAQASADGKRLVMSTPLQTRLLDTLTGQRLARSDALEPGEQERVQTIPLLLPVALSPDGELLAGSDGTRTPVVWNLKKSQRHTWPGPFSHGGTITGLRFTPQGKLLLVVSEDVRTRLWSVAQERVEPASEWLTHSGTVRQGWFSPDERFLLTVCDEGSARVWDVQTSLPITPPLRHAAAVVTAAWNRDGRRVLTAGRDGSVRVWDLTTLAAPTRVLLHEGSVTSVAFSPSGDRLLTGSEDGTARVWDVATGRTVVPHLRHAGPVTAARWNPEGTRVVTLSQRNMRVWEAATGEVLSRSWGDYLGNNSGVSQAHFRPEGGELLMVFAERANLVDLGPPDRVARSVRHEDNQDIRHVAFAPDGKHLATSDKKGELRVWDGVEEQPLERLPNLGRISELTFLDPTRLAVLGSFGLIVRDVRTPRELQHLPAEPEDYRATHLSADGRWLVTVSQENACRVWDVARGQAVGHAFQAGGTLGLVAVTAGGAQAVTVLHEGEVRLWDTATGEPLTAPQRLGTYVADACLSPDGTQVALAGRDGKAYLWKLPSRDPREERSLSRLARLLAAQQVDGHTEILQTVAGGELTRLATEVPEQLPEQFTVSGEQVSQWHAQQADDAERVGQWSAVLFHLDYLLKRQPERLELLSRRATVLGKLERQPEALTVLGTLIEKQPREPRHRERRALALMLQNRWQEAQQDVTAALDSEPNNGSLWLRQHYLQRQLQQLAAARASYSKALELGIDLTYRPYFDRAYRRAVGYAFEPQFRRDSTYQRDPRQTFDLRKQWQPLLDDLAHLKAPDATLSRCRGVALGTLGDWETARQEFVRAAKTLPPGADAESARGLALAAVAARDRPTAKEHLDRALQQEPGDGSLWFLRACLLQAEGGDGDAILQALNRAIDNGADHGASRMERGVLLLERDHFAQAEVDFSAVVSREKSPARAVYALRGLARAGQQKWEEAAGDLRQAADMLKWEAQLARDVLLVQTRIAATGEARAEQERRLKVVLHHPRRTMENDDRWLGEVIRTAVVFRISDLILADWLKYFEKVLDNDRKLTPEERARIAGAAYCRLGEWDHARRKLGAACRADEDGGTAWEWYFLALTHCGVQDWEKARTAVAKAKSWLAAHKARRLQNVCSNCPLTWQQEQELALLAAEVDALLRARR